MIYHIRLNTHIIMLSTLMIEGFDIAIIQFNVCTWLHLKLLVN